MNSSEAESVNESYISLARPQQWWKNLLVLVGIWLSFAFESIAESPVLLSSSSLTLIAAAIVSVCCLASANYVLNEILDVTGDRHHPLKKQRGLASATLNVQRAYGLWTSLMLSGLLLAWMVNLPFLILSVLFVVAALCYNVPPLRCKDLPLLDVLCEGINSPIRVWLGWSIFFPEKLPSSILLFACWMLGICLMSLKRSGELTAFETQEQAALYRKSFAYYSKRRLRNLQIISLVFAGVSLWSLIRV